MAMALKSMVRRWPAAPSQARALLLQQSRFYADEYTGKGLNEKEKAAENRFIKNLEDERKLKKEVAEEARAHAESSITPPSATTEAASAKTESVFPFTAVIAGLAVAIGGYWLLSGSSKKEEEK